MPIDTLFKGIICVNIPVEAGEQIVFCVFVISSNE